MLLLIWRHKTRPILKEKNIGLSYYERFTAAYEALLVERGVMTNAEIDQKMSELEREKA